MNDKLKCIGQVEVYERNVGEKAWVLRETVKNIIVNQGLGFLATQFIGSTTTSTAGYFAVSESSTAPTAATTALASEVTISGGATRKAFDSKTWDATQLKFSLIAILLSTEANGTGTTTIRQFAVCTALTGSNAYNVAVLSSPITKNSTKEVQFRYTTTFSSS